MLSLHALSDDVLLKTPINSYIKDKYKVGISQKNLMP